MSQSTGNVLLVGSVPLDPAEEVFRMCAANLSSHLKMLPDGEVGARKSWIQCQAIFVFDRHPSIECVKRPKSPDGLSRVDKLDFADLRYADWAAHSYQVFHELRQQGVIPSEARFQVSLPTPLGGCAAFFDQPRDRETVYRAYEAAMLREVDRICSQIPHDELALQWDVCVEVLEIAAGLPQLLPGDPWTRAGTQFERIAAVVPSPAMLGFHFCYGDLAHHHLVEPANLSVSVRIANVAMSSVKRSVNWVHMPVPVNRGDDVYFAPLRDLRVATRMCFWASSICTTAPKVH